jgi:hypothetical protein
VVLPVDSLLVLPVVSLKGAEVLLSGKLVLLFSVGVLLLSLLLLGSLLGPLLLVSVAPVVPVAPVGPVVPVVPVAPVAPVTAVTCPVDVVMGRLVVVKSPLSLAVVASTGPIPLVMPPSKPTPELGLAPWAQAVAAAAAARTSARPRTPTKPEVRKRSEGSMEVR